MAKYEKFDKEKITSLGKPLKEKPNYRVHLEIVTEEKVSPSVLVLVEIFERCLNMVQEKDKGYGGAWKDQGWQGNVARILSKASRIRSMVWRDEPVEGTEESVTDTLYDMINLCGFALENFARSNRWGNGGR